MDQATAYRLFHEMNQLALSELIDYTSNNIPVATEKIDRSVFSGADQRTNDALCDFSRRNGLKPVGEESPEDLSVVRSGNYVTIDSIDGSGHYLKHVEGARAKKLQVPHIDPELGDNFDYAVIIGIVENGRPRFGSYFSYVSGELIMVDSDSINHTVWERGSNLNLYLGEKANYTENRVELGINENNSAINRRISDIADKTHNVGPLGRRCLYAQLGSHESAAVYHMGLQENGLWDILPTCVLAETPENRRKTRIYDGNGNPIVFTEYAQTPNKGVILTHGPEFEWISKEIR
tara:strand:- start:5847 stop:6722 length:876 start_codon:yes stop_codon:yes gene_type:complete